MIGCNPLDEFVPPIQGYVADVVMTVAFFADVTGLATAIAGLREGFEGSSVVDVHRDARTECARRGVHCCRDRGGWGM
jgi:hypothetical protein